MDDYSAAFSGDSASGNYIALHIIATDENSAAADSITVEIVNGFSGPVTLDADGLYVGRIADKSTQIIKVVAYKDGYDSVTSTFRLDGMTVQDS